MTPEQALTILHQAAEAALLNGKDRDTCRQAAQFLADKLGLNKKAADAPAPQ